MSRIVGTGYVACPTCAGGLPGDVADDLVCRCGTDGGLVADWRQIEAALMARSGSRCEIRSPACLGGAHGDLTRLPRERRSIHHRRPRGMGGTRRADVHSLAMLVNTCGDGVAGCHGYAESHRVWAEARGLLIPKVGLAEVTDPARVPLVLPGGRRVLLDPNGFYARVPDGIDYAVVPETVADTPGPVPQA